MSETVGENPRERLKQLFAQAIELPAEQRAAFLVRECGGDAHLRSAVDSLLAAEEDAGDFLAGPTAAGTHVAAATAQTQQVPRENVGPYKLLQVIGEGGFGTVYLAEQESPVRRRVALKLIKLGMDTNQVIARFEAERQALAIMDHPNIARVFDAGATVNGRPYFVMELVKGEPITNYCDGVRLTTQQRLELFIPVCQAVQHAHQKGIIHRDIKPTNVLVTLHDGKPVPKIIDFGVAKATQARLTERTLFTEFRQMIGTPEYMSPEQAEMSGLDVDTRSDVYSLGVLLYELLAGAPPFDPRELRSKALVEMQRVIREVDPPRPSTRLSTLESLPNIAARRSTEPKKLSATIRGELDWIVMKCLEKDRTRRYDSASALANDIAHHLADEPVSASNVNATYRARKFARRHRVGLAVTISIATALCVGLVIALAALKRETRAKNDAIAAKQQAEDAQKAEAEARAYEKETDRFLIGMFDALDPAESHGQEVTVRDVLEQASKRLEADPPKHVLAEASLRFVFATAFTRLGAYERARLEMERALELEIKSRGNEDKVVATVTNNLADLYLQMGQAELAESTYRRALDLHRRTYGPDHRATMNTQANLGSCLTQLNKFEEADALLTGAMDYDRTHSTAADQAAILKNTVADIRLHRGRYAEAEALQRDAVQAYTALHGSDHPDTIALKHALADTLLAADKIDEAVVLGGQVVTYSRRVLSATHPMTLRFANAQAVRLQSAGRLDEAAALLTETIVAMKAMLGEDNPRTLLARGNRASVLLAQDRLNEALAEFTDVVARMRKLNDPNNANFLVTENQLAVTLAKLGRLAEAETMMRDQLSRARQMWGDRGPKTFSFLASLGSVLMDEQKLNDAEPLLADAYTGAKTAGLPPQPQLSGNYGVCLAQLQRHAEALPLLLEADAALAKARQPERELRERVTAALIDAYDKTGKHSDAQRLRDRSSTRPATAPNTRPNT